MTMARTNGFDKKMAGLVYRVHVGDSIRITRTYVFCDVQKGKVTRIDDAGRLWGTWGGQPVIPGVDDFLVIKSESADGV